MQAVYLVIFLEKDVPTLTKTGSKSFSSIENIFIALLLG